MSDDEPFLTPEPMEVSKARLSFRDSCWEGFMPTPKKKEYTFTLEEVRALHDFIEHEFVPHIPILIATVRKIQEIMKENE